MCTKNTTPRRWDLIVKLGSFDWKCIFHHWDPKFTHTSKNKCPSKKRPLFFSSGFALRLFCSSFLKNFDHLILSCQKEVLVECIIMVQFPLKIRILKGRTFDIKVVSSIAPTVLGEKTSYCSICCNTYRTNFYWNHFFYSFTESRVIEQYRHFWKANDSDWWIKIPDRTLLKSNPFDNLFKYKSPN